MNQSTVTITTADPMPPVRSAQAVRAAERTMAAEFGGVTHWSANGYTPQWGGETVRVFTSYVTADPTETEYSAKKAAREIARIFGQECVVLEIAGAAWQFIDGPTGGNA